MLFKKKQKTIDPYSKYVDPTGELPNRELEIARWYLLHKARLKKIGIGILAAFCVITVGYSLYRWLEYFIVGYGEDQRALVAQRRSLSDVPKTAKAANGFAVGDVRVFQSADERYDFSALAHNEHAKMIATVTYQYAFLGGETPMKQTRILPGRSAPLTIYGVPTSSYPADVKLTIDGIQWQRVNPHVISNREEYMAARLQFMAENISFIPALAEGGVPSNHVSFDVVNKSAYSYWQAQFAVEFLDGETVTAVAPLSIERFRAGETRHVEFGILYTGAGIRDVRLIPDINVFDRSVFMPPGA